MKSNNLVTLILITVFSSGLTMVSSFLLAHLLSVDERGIVQLFITAVTYVVTVGAGGVGFVIALSMRNKQYVHWQRYLCGFLLYTVLISCIALYLFDLTSFPVLFVFNAVFIAILNITLEKSKIDHNLRIYRILTLQQPILTVILYGSCYFIWGEQPVDTVLYLLTALMFIQMALCLLYLKRINREFKQNNAVAEIDRKFFLQSWLKQNLLQVFGATTVNIDKFLIVSFLGNYTLGLYTVCMAFDALATKFINILVDYYYSGLLNNINRIKAVLAVIGLISLSSVILVPLLAEPVIGFFFSSKYVEVAPVTIWIILNSILAGMSWLLSQNMLIQGKQVLLFASQVISIFVFITLFYLLKEQQLFGVAYALLGASFTRLMISTFYYFKFPVKPKSAVVS